MEINELEKKYSELIKDDDFDLLSTKLNEPNIFKILGVENYEVKHSNFLAWLLDPNESHGINDYFLNRFLQNVFLDDRAHGLSVVSIPSIDNKKIEIKREWKNIDLLIDAEDFVVCIENKFGSKEHSNQLARYKKIVEKEFKNKKIVFVFLSPYGEEASMNNIYVNYSYERIVEILESIIRRSSLYLSDPVKSHINDYLVILKQNLMANDDVNSLAEQLYKNHHELFDFVFNNRPDHRSYFAEVFNKFIIENGLVQGTKNKNYVRFTTKKLAQALTPYAVRNGGWLGREPLLFEFLTWSDRYVFFQVAFSPGPKQRELINVVLQEDENAITQFKTWFSCFHDKLTFSYQVIDDLRKKEFQDELNEFLKRVLDTVNKVEGLLLQKKD